jgi:photosystem II stability/assembly factor-like uncharacterized protein
MKRNIRTILSMFLLAILLMPASVAAQEPGLIETFDDPVLPEWEHSPNATVINGWLHLEPDGFAFHGGTWNNMNLGIRTRMMGNGTVVIKYQATDQTAYVLRFAVGSIILQRQSGESSTDLGTANLEIPPGEPAMIVVTVSGGRHQISVNGNVKITASDTQPLPPGGLFLSAEGAVVEFDEVTLTAGGEPALAQATESVPTSALPQPTIFAAVPQAITSGVPAYQADSWVALGGPPGDLGYDIRYNFDDHNTWYVTDGQGGFFISTDRGLSWKQSNQGIGSLNNTILRPVFSATVDPHNPQTIWIGTQITGHIYKSIDGGQNWVQKGIISPNQGQHFRGFTVSPTSSDIVYAQAEVDCVLLSTSCPPPAGGKLTPSGGRIYRTTNGGDNWDLIWQGDALARYLWIDPNNVNTLYVSTGIFDRTPMETSPDGAGVLKSTDGGKSWTVLGKFNGLENQYVGSLYMHPQDSQILLAGAGIANSKVLDPETGKDVLNGGVFLTTDGGAHWTKVIKNDAFGAVEFCAQDPTIAYAAGQAATYRSEDGGKTWQKFGDEQRETWGPMGVYPGLPIDLQTDPDDCSRVFLNNYIGGNFLSTDSGETWTIATSGYSGAQVYNVFVDPEDAAHVYATTRMAPFVSHDGGSTWQGMSDAVMKTSVSALAIDPSNADHLLASQGKNYLVSKDGGQSWQSFEIFTPPADTVDSNEPYWMAFGGFAFAASNPTIVYATSRNDASNDPDTIIQPDKYPGLGIYRSADGGLTWQPANDVNTDNEGFTAIVVHPTDPQIVYAAGHYDAGVFKTTDGGQTWTAINNGLPQLYERFYAMAIAPDAPDTLILLGKAGVFKTTNGGSSWKQLSSGIDANAKYRGIVFDPTNGQVVYLGSSTLGVSYSTDGGETFQPLTQGLDTSLGGLPIKFLGISADGSVLYVATHGSGVWRLGTPVITVNPTPTSAATQPAAQPPSSTPQQTAQPSSSTPPPAGTPSPCGGAIAIPFGMLLLAQWRRKPRK